jgi:hypothetical protein
MRKLICFQCGFCEEKGPNELQSRPASSIKVVPILRKAKGWKRKKGAKPILGEFKQQKMTKAASTAIPGDGGYGNLKRKDLSG